MEAVLNRLIERVDSEELKIFVHTVLIQRIVGGNLPEVLSHMAGTLEERERVHKEIKTLTAESKQVSYLLPAMPVVMVIMMNLVMPGFLNPLFTPFGLVLLAIVIVLQVLAFVIISKMSKVRV
ncbi:Flp pilus assembly protein TadB [Geomicrobium sp. JCM 19039]|nr:Flp pilus assembly protein TadB [Geomicrobium sp. JCM 19039]